MEVHHHPKLEKKNFKEYFPEFLQLLFYADVPDNRQTSILFYIKLLVP